MIRINWDEVEATKAKLFREGATEAFEMVIVVLYHTRSECDKIQIRLGQLERSLFDIGDNNNVRGIFLFDVGMKHPYLKCEEASRASHLETVANSGHPNILLDFKSMSVEGRDVWVEIALARLQHYISHQEAQQ
jgi:hypothetical protein